jgi:hypothetical protein
VSKDGELALGDRERFLLERVDRAVENDEPDEMPRWPDRERPELVALGGPLGQRLVPWQVEERRGVLAKAEPREACREGGVGQSRFRRYVVTVAS